MGMLKWNTMTLQECLNDRERRNTALTAANKVYHFAATGTTQNPQSFTMHATPTGPKFQ